MGQRAELLQRALDVAGLGARRKGRAARRERVEPVVLAGRAEEQANTTADMILGAQVALASIYVILAWVFASYTRPLVVMFIIPFGLIGAVFGHMLMGFNLTMMSFIALLGLSGILVNDSIILVGTIDEHREKGLALADAVVAGCQERLRAIILTSATTVVGLLPLLFETSMQARFLIPMAITIAFGLLTATVLVLGLVPALIGVGEDGQQAVIRIRSRLSDRRRLPPQSQIPNPD